jgi:Tfp pilus assembly protein PilF
MKKLEVMVLMIFFTTIVILSQDYSGRGKVTGYVYDEESNPLEGVKVKLFLLKTQSGFETLTDTKGKWEANWISGGVWNIDYEKVGYETKRISTTIMDDRKNPPYEVKMKKLEGLVITEELKNDLNEGNKLFKEGKYEEAKRVYEEILEKHPDAYIINLTIGNCYFQLERYDQAEEYYLKVLEKNAKNSNALLGIGNCYSNQGEEERAFEWYGKIEFEKINDPTVLFNIGTTFYNNSQYKEALKYYQRAVEIQEDFLDAVYQLGLAYLTLGNNQEALITFENYLKHDSDSERRSQVMGFIEFLKKKDENKGRMLR